MWPVLVGVGLLMALAVGTGLAGWWVLGGIVLAAGLRWCSLWTVHTGRSVPSRWIRGVEITAWWAYLPLCATIFAVYLFPLHADIAGVGFVFAVTAVVLTGRRISHLNRWSAGLLVIGAGVLIALCLAIPPVVTTTGSLATGPGELLLATAIFLPVLRITARSHQRWILVGATVLAGVVTFVSLYQLGPIRLGLSSRPLQDVLLAADAEALKPWLLAVVGVTTISAGCYSLGEARGRIPINFRLPAITICGLCAALVTYFLNPTQALYLASGAATVELVLGFTSAIMGRYRRQNAQTSLE